MPIEKRLTPDQQQLLEDPNEVIAMMDREFNEAQLDGRIDVIEQDDGSVEIDLLGEGGETDAVEEEEFSSNLAEYIDEAELQSIGNELLELVEQDKEDRADWERILTDAIELLGLKYEELQEPFPGASAVTHPLLIESIVNFQAKAYGELVPSAGPVRTKILGKITPEKEAQARRVKEYMNYQTMYEMTEYVPEMDALLFNVGLTGSAFKKTYYDAVLGRPVSRFVKAEDFIVPYTASDLLTTPRFAHQIHLSTNDMRKSVLAGLYRDMGQAAMREYEESEEAVKEIEGFSGASIDEEEYTLYEVYIDYDLPGFEDESGVAVPYVITVDKNSGDVLSIYRNWKEADQRRQKRIYFSHYRLIPGLGFYGYGFLHLIGGLTKTATSTMRQLIDAGTFANLPAGFKAHGLRVTGNDEPIMPGTFKEVNAPAMDISKAIIPLPFKEPSATLFNLLQFVVEAGQKFADKTDQVIADSTNYGPVGTTMALLEASGKLFSAIHKRLHFSQMHDLRVLADLNFEVLPVDGYPYEIEGTSQQIFKSDFDGRIDVIPVSDPNMPSRSHRVAKANALHQLAMAAPQIHNLKAVYQEAYAALDYDPSKFLTPDPPPPQPLDPITENMVALSGKPSGTAEWEDHEAHIKVHTAFILDPQMAQNQQATAIIAAHISEHLAWKYRNDMQREMGIQLPPVGQQMKPEEMNAIARKAVPAAEIVKQKDMQDFQAMPMAQNPELAIKAKDSETKAAQVRVKAQVDQTKAELDRAKLALQAADQAHKHAMEEAKLRLEREQMERDDQNADLDRAVDLKTVKMQMDAAKEKEKNASPKSG